MKKTNLKSKSNKLKKGIVDETTEVSRILKITIGVVAFLVLVYLIAALAKGEIKLGKDPIEEAQIQYTEILAEQTFKQKKSTYYVIYYDFEDNMASLYDTIVSSSENIYKVDLHKAFNKNYLVDDNIEIITNPENLSQLKVKNPTMLKIVNGKVEKLVTGEKNVIAYSKTK